MFVEDNEEWRNVAEYEDIYEVSSLGNVRNKKTKRILKPTLRGGYAVIGLCKNSKGKTIPIHRLVAIAFIPNPDNKPQVNHIDKVRNNNCIKNLEWMTSKENNIHKSSSLVQTTNQRVKVWRIDKETNEKLQKYNSIEEASIWLYNNGFASSKLQFKSGISTCINGKYNFSCGFKWQKAEYESLEGEEWKNIIIDGKEVANYYVSTLGRFKNSKGIIMENYKPHHSGYIYLRVNKEKYALHR